MPLSSLLRFGWRLQMIPSFLLMLALLLFSTFSNATYDSLVGINYGRVANNLPPPSAVPPLLASIGVGRVRLYDADPAVLHAFANTGVELLVGVPDQCVAAVANPNDALTWVKSSIQPFVPATKIIALTVGNEVLTGNNSALLSHSLLPAMQSLHAALVELNLDHMIWVTTAHNLGVLGTSYPPSSTAFRDDLLPYICPIIDFHAKTGSPFLINAYPYFAYGNDPTGVNLPYALLEPGCTGVTDSGTGLYYPNMLYAQVDAVYHAMAAANSDAAKVVEVRVSETGWPSCGDANETGASPQNAAKYNGNVMKLVAQGKGTPLKQGVPLRAYVFALFNENMKPGPTSERNYGLFKPDGTPVYPLGLAVLPENTSFPSGDGGNASGYGHGDGGGGGYNSTDGNIDGGYYSISAASRGKGTAAITGTLAAGVAVLMGLL